MSNELSWHGCPEKDPSAVHLDILDAEVKLCSLKHETLVSEVTDSFFVVQILGINMAVGIDGYLGKSMIREGREIHVYVRRSLRDIFRKVPNFSLEVKVCVVLCF